MRCTRTVRPHQSRQVNSSRVQERRIIPRIRIQRIPEVTLNLTVLRSVAHQAVLTTAILAQIQQTNIII